MRDSLRAGRNQLANVGNPFQGEYRKVLFLCSAGLLRSATAAHIFSQEPYNWNTRTAGVSLSFALNPVSEALMEWADFVVCMEQEVYDELVFLFGEVMFEDEMPWKKKTRVFSIPDKYQYRAPELILDLKRQMSLYAHAV